MSELLKFSRTLGQLNLSSIFKPTLVSKVSTIFGLLLDGLNLSFEVIDGDPFSVIGGF